MNLRGQKVQTGGPAATLVGLLTIIFIFYILLLPADERRDLLTDRDQSIEGERALLNETPGYLSSSQKGYFDHLLPNVYLTKTLNAAILASENPFTTYNGWFTERRKIMQFSIDSLERAESVVLSFQAPERKGTLVITLNGRIVFSGAISTQNIAPVMLPKQLLQSTNTLEFYVVGSFFQRQRYTLTDVKIIADITDIQKQQAVSSFTISEQEHANSESAYIEFYAQCDQGNTGVLTIELNGRIVHSGLPACDSLNREDLFVEDLKQSKNILTFKLDAGSYRLEQTRVRTILKPVKNYIDYFNIKSALYNTILDRKAKIILKIEFVDDSKVKQAQVSINGKFDAIDQRTPNYEKDISTEVREGNNYFEITPLTELNIARVEIRVE